MKQTESKNNFVAPDYTKSLHAGTTVKITNLSCDDAHYPDRAKLIGEVHVLEKSIEPATNLLGSYSGQINNRYYLQAILEVAE